MANSLDKIPVANPAHVRQWNEQSEIWLARYLQERLREKILRAWNTPQSIRGFSPGPLTSQGD